jgi:hypothetical protein
MALTTTWFVYNVKIITSESIEPITERPTNYNPDLYWDGSDWSLIEVAGGGRYKNNLVVIGENSTGQGLIYYGEV